MIRAIETRYAGCRFRSRREARWAVFFDHLGIAWEYETEGFVTSTGWYLPDFRIKTAGRYQWFEVKPDDAPNDTRHAAFAAESNVPLIVTRGMPRSYRDQLRGAESAIKVHLGTRVIRCAFVAGRQGYVEHEPAWGKQPARNTFRAGFSGTWASLGKNTVWYCGQDERPHLAIWHHDVPCSGFCLDGAGSCGYPPFDCLDVDDAYTAARSARFEHGQSGAR